MVTYRLFVEALLHRVTRVRDGKVQKKVVTKTPYKMNKDKNAVLMSSQERFKRQEAARKAAKTGRDKHAQKKRRQKFSNHMRNVRHIEDTKR